MASPIIPGSDEPHTEVDLIPGVGEQGQGIRIYVEGDYARKS